MSVMMEAVCVLVPPLLAAVRYRDCCGKSVSTRRLLYIYALMVGIINLFPMVIVAFVTRHPDYYIEPRVFSIGFSIKYLLCGFAAALAAPKILCVIKEIVKIDIVVEKAPDARDAEGAPEVEEK